MTKSASRKLHFPAKLYTVIELEDNSIIRWEENGKCFRIIDHARFEQEVLPKYFRREYIPMHA